MDIEEECKKLGFLPETIYKIAIQQGMTPEEVVTALPIEMKSFGPPRKHPGIRDVPFILPGRPPIDWNDPRPLSETHPPLPKDGGGSEV